MGKLGINTLRIPTTYAAWVDVPYSSLYHGQQQAHLSKICNYAIDKYNMHVVRTVDRPRFQAVPNFLLTA